MIWELYSYVDWENDITYPITSFQGNNNDENSTTQICLADGCYMFSCGDTYGDGWQGGYVEASTNDQQYGEYSVEESFGFFTFEINTKACVWEFPGCTDENAYNYNSQANTDNESCIYEGCTDVNSCNYESIASIDNGTCEYTSCLGCTDPLAINYDQGSSIDDGSCAYSCSENWFIRSEYLYEY